MINPYGINNDGRACIVTLPNQDPEYGYAIISTFIASIIQERNNESNAPLNQPEVINQDIQSQEHNQTPIINTE